MQKYVIMYKPRGTLKDKVKQILWICCETALRLAINQRTESIIVK